MFPLLQAAAEIASDPDRVTANVYQVVAGEYGQYEALCDEFLDTAKLADNLESEQNIGQMLWYAAGLTCHCGILLSQTLVGSRKDVRIGDVDLVSALRARRNGHERWANAGNYLLEATDSFRVAANSVTTPDYDNMPALDMARRRRALAHATGELVISSSIWLQSRYGATLTQTIASNTKERLSRRSFY